MKKIPRRYFSFFSTSFMFRLTRYRCCLSWQIRIFPCGWLWQSCYFFPFVHLWMFFFLIELRCCWYVQLMQEEFCRCFSWSLCRCNRYYSWMKVIKKTLWHLIMDRAQLSQSCSTTKRRQFTFNHQVLRDSWYSFDWPQRDGGSIELGSTQWF